MILYKPTATKKLEIMLYEYSLYEEYIFFIYYIFYIIYMGNFT